MWLLPFDLVVIIITVSVLIFVIYVILVIRVSNKLITNKDMLGIVTSLADILTGGDKMEEKTNLENLEKFTINGTDFSVQDNTLNLEELVLQNDTDEDYKDYLDVIKSLVLERYKKFRFLRISPTHEDYNSGYFLSFTITRDQVPVEYEYLFRLAISKGLTDSKINDLFFKKVKDGDILPLGDVEVVVGTGISPVTQADDIMVNIVFMPRDYYNKHIELQEQGK